MPLKGLPLFATREQKLQHAKDIYNATTELQRSNMTRFCRDKTALVRYVSDQLKSLPSDLPLTIIIEPEKSAGFYATSVITKSSVVSTILKSLREPVIT
jgi:hypothetical protein